MTWKFCKDELPKKQGPYLVYVFISENAEFEQRIEWFDYQEEYIRSNDTDTIIRKSKDLSFDERWHRVYAWRNLPDPPDKSKIWK